MATAPRPRILPRITYAPPQSDPPKGLGGGADAGTAFSQYLGLAGIQQGIGGQADGMGNYPTTPQDWLALMDTQPPATVTYPNQPPPSQAAPVSPTIPNSVDNRGMQGGPQGGQNYGQPPANTPGTVPQSALTNNRSNMAAAQAAGDTANIARLDAEWKRIAPLAQARGITAERLVNSYMQPGNPAAKSDLNSALAAAISDDVWAQEATNAFGRPPNQLEWDEHWRAMNVGGRDPLEGHPQAVQNIQAAMQNLGNENQSGQYDAYSQWLAGQK